MTAGVRARPRDMPGAMTSESITVGPTWGFEFRAVLPDHQRLNSDEHEVEVDLGDPVGRVTMEARRGAHRDPADSCRPDRSA